MPLMNPGTKEGLIYLQSLIPLDIANKLDLRTLTAKLTNIKEINWNIWWKFNQNLLEDIWNTIQNKGSHNRKHFTSCTLLTSVPQGQYFLILCSTPSQIDYHLLQYDYVSLDAFWRCWKWSFLSVGRPSIPATRWWGLQTLCFLQPAALPPQRFPQNRQLS